VTSFNPAIPDVVQFFKVLADETRLAVVQRLALSDLRVGEIVERLHAPQNVISYHLKQLRALGLLRDQRSSADGRDVYYSVDLERLQQLYLAAGTALHPGINAESSAEPVAAAVERPLRVLFLCTHNSARSQLAEGIMRYLGGANVEVFSAGSLPAQVHPLALELLAEWQIDTSPVLRLCDHRLRSGAG
jgi:ArsR family transcriptional regulator, arsenate/arsenite/antimonite-responsive transcriptional repressor / arsenate reductase (thioredoxin)